MTERKLNVVPSQESLIEVQAALEEMMDVAMVPMKIAMKMDIVVDEIFSNIVNYSGASEAEVGIRIGDGRIELSFTDDGMQYNPLEAENPDVTVGLEEREIGGLGILITKKLMDEVQYTYTDGRNHLCLVKEI